MAIKNQTGGGQRSGFIEVGGTTKGQTQPTPKPAQGYPAQTQQQPTPRRTGGCKSCGQW